MLVQKMGWRVERGEGRITPICQSTNPLKLGGLENLEVEYFLGVELF